ncbi:MAG: ABC transporter ATP-binding protein [Actinobacteria bacterium]|nr:ABC transporter ATP-binding protein [Actinomycetota bacterium]
MAKSMRSWESEDHAFSPLGLKALVPGPQGHIDPDSSRSWLRRIFPLLRTHRVTFITSIALSFLGLILQVQIPQLMSQAINHSLVVHDVPLSHYVWWILGLGLIGALANLIARMALYRTAYLIESDLRNTIFEQFAKLSFSFYDRVQSGQLISRANSDIRSVQMYTTLAPLILVQCAIGIVAFCYMLAINVLLAIIAMSTMPLLYRAGMRMRNAMFPISWIIQARLAEVATVVDENVSGVRVVKSFAREQDQLDDLSRASTKLSWAYIKDADLRAEFTPLVQSLPQIGLALVLGFGGYMVIHGSLSIGAILAFNAYLLMLQAPFMMLGMLIMMGQRASASAERIFEILDEVPEITDKPGAVDLTDCTGSISFRDVSFSYREDLAPVLSHLNLEVAAGETVAVVGRTGSGKSTLARLITRFYDVSEGSVEVDGHDVRKLSFLFSASLHDNIAFGKPLASREAVVAAAKAAKADAFIRDLDYGYETVVGERGYSLSGGQRQRISIARALLVNPEILILDDATSAIDVGVEAAIHEALEGMLKQRTTVIIAHRLSTIALADRVVVLEGGQLVGSGSHQWLLENVPTYSEILASVEAEVAVAEEA